MKTTRLAAISLMASMAAAMPAAASAQSATPAQSATCTQAATSTQSATTAQSPPAKPAARGVQVKSGWVVGPALADFFRRHDQSEWARIVRSRSRAGNGYPPRGASKPGSDLSKLIREAGPGIEETLRNMGTVIEIRHP